MQEFLSAAIKDKSYVVFHTDSEKVSHHHILLRKKDVDQSFMKKPLVGFAATGQIERQHDAEFVEELCNQGAYLESHKMDIPNYKSWAVINPGKHLALRQGDWSIEYVPFEHFGEKFSKEIKKVLNINKKLIDEVEKALILHMLSSPFARLGHIQGQASKNKFQNKKSSVLVFAQPVYLHSDIVEFGFAKKQVDEYVVEIEYLKEIRDNPKFSLGGRLATESECMIKIDGESYLCRFAKASDLNETWKQTEYGLVKISVAESLAFSFLQSLLQKATINWPAEAEFKGLFQKHAEKLVYHEDVDLSMADLLYDLLQGLPNLENYLEEQICYEKSQKHLSAPFSEKGCFVIHAKTLQGISQALKHFGMESHEGRNWVHDYGVLDYYVENPDIKPQIPAGSVIIHGMTGANGSNSIERLNSIIEHGGLLSYTERRRRGIQLESMSPLGDLASGIDWAVPCKIGDEIAYGENIFFVMRPSVLLRKHMFFAPKDFGGGASRWNHYKKYANSLGQENIWDAPSHEARQKHFELIGRPNNETWFKGSISTEEIAAIVVGKHLFDKVSKIVKQAQQKGKMPKDTKVYNIVQKADFQTISKKIADEFYKGFYKEKPKPQFDAEKSIKSTPSKYYKPLYSEDDYLMDTVKEDIMPDKDPLEYDSYTNDFYYEDKQIHKHQDNYYAANSFGDKMTFSNYDTYPEWEHKQKYKHKKYE